MCEQENQENKMKRSLKVLKRNPEKCAEAGINKQTEYTKELIKENPVRKCIETGDKYNGMIRTKREDQAW